jgi:hypothetical protein
LYGRGPHVYHAIAVDRRTGRAARPAPATNHRKTKDDRRTCKGPPDHVADCTNHPDYGSAAGRIDAICPIVGMLGSIVWCQRSGRSLSV